MSYSEYIEAFKIFDKYENSGFIHPTHDEIHAGPNPTVVSDQDKERLKELGWNDYGEGSFMCFT